MKHVKTEMQRLATMVYTDLNSNHTLIPIAIYVHTNVYIPVTIIHTAAFRECSIVAFCLYYIERECLRTK